MIDSKGDPKLPAFLYDDDLMDGSLARGLFRGPFLLSVSVRHSRELTLMTFLKVYKHIFVSPTAATGAKASLKGGNARIHGMQKVIPSTICYAAIQVCSLPEILYSNAI